jgi:hypothetical protein
MISNTFSLCNNIMFKASLDIRMHIAKKEKKKMPKEKSHRSD